MGKSAAVKNPHFICPLTFLLSDAPALYMQFSHQRAKQKLCSPLCIYLGLNLMPVGAKWKQLSESNFQRHLRLQVLFAPNASVLQSSRKRLILWEGMVSLHEGLCLSQSSHPPQSVFLPWDSLWMDTLSFTTEQRGPSPGRDLLGRYFICHPIPSCWLSSVKRHCGINPWRSDSVTLVRDGSQILGIRKHKITSLILVSGVCSWKWDLKCQKNQGKNREQKCVTHLRY